METPQRPEDEFRVSPAQFVLLQLFFFCCNLTCRTLDLLVLLPRPRLLRAYLGLWWAGLLKSPYRWPRSFESVQRLKSTGQTVRELMYGETPVFTALWLFWRAGLRKGGTLVDLGAGRGRALLAARWLGAEARGVELLDSHVARTAGLLKRAGIVLLQGDAMLAPLEDATAVFVNWTGLSDATRHALTKRFRQCRPGTRFIATTQPIPGIEFVQRSRQWMLFTWGTARVWIQERKD